MSKTMAKPYLLSATQVRALFRNNSITVEEYAISLLGRIEERDSIVKAWAFLGELLRPSSPNTVFATFGRSEIHVLILAPDPVLVLSQARALDEIPHGQRGPLHGLAIGIKDIMNTKGKLSLYRQSYTPDDLSRYAHAIWLAHIQEPSFRF